MKLSNSQYASLMRSYDAKRNEHRAILDERIAEVQKRIPEYAELSKLASRISLEAAQNAILNKSFSPEEMNSKLADIANTKKDLLVSAGYPENYLEPICDCKLCKDTGFVDGEKCICFKQAAIDLLYNQSNIKKILKKENFKNFNYKLYSDSLIDERLGQSARQNINTVVEELENFIEHFPSGKNVFLYGDTGVGKTFLTHCVAAELLAKGYSVLYLTANELFDFFSKYSFRSDEEMDTREIFSQILDCDLLIIDDLGTELANAFTNSKLFYCISERAAIGNSTMISSNLDLSGIMNTYSERIFSRLTQSYSIYKIFGEDLRLYVH